MPNNKYDDLENLKVAFDKKNFHQEGIAEEDQALHFVHSIAALLNVKDYEAAKETDEARKAFMGKKNALAESMIVRQLRLSGAAKMLLERIDLYRRSVASNKGVLQPGDEGFVPKPQRISGIMKGRAAIVSDAKRLLLEVEQHREMDEKGLFDNEFGFMQEGFASLTEFRRWLRENRSVEAEMA